MLKFILGLMVGGTVGFMIFALCSVAKSADNQSGYKLNNCRWCKNHKGKSELQFSVIDDDFGQYVRESMIKFCPFCGRELIRSEDK